MVNDKKLVKQEKDTWALGYLFGQWDEWKYGAEGEAGLKETDYDFRFAGWIFGVYVIFKRRCHLGS